MLIPYSYTADISAKTIGSRGLSGQSSARRRTLKIFLDELKLVLKQNNFEVLLEKIVDKEFHIHSHTLEQILTSNPDEIFFVCNHCK